MARFFLGVSKPTIKYNSFHFNCITLLTNVCIASEEIVSATHLCQDDVTLQMNRFTASDELVSATHLQI